MLWRGETILPIEATMASLSQHQPHLFNPQVHMRTHRVLSNVTRWTLGTFYGLRRLHLSRYFEPLS